MKQDKQSDLIIAMVLAHSFNRLMLNFDCYIVKNGRSERDNNFNVIVSRINKFLRKREKSNLHDFIFATEFERVFWLSATDAYDVETPVFAINVVSIIYDYHSDILKKYVSLNEKIMIKLAAVHTRTELDAKKFREIENNDDSFSNTYIRMLEPYSGVGLKKSLFSGKKLIIKNNMIIENVKVKEGF